MQKRERGYVDVVTIIIGLALGLLIIGFFRSDKSFFDKINFKSMMRLSCGLTYSGISDYDKVTFPLEITGYINGCGWDQDGSGLGTAQIFDNKGLPVSSPTKMVVSDNSTELPYPFVVDLRLNAAPTTDDGQLILRSNAGLTKIIPITF